MKKLLAVLLVLSLAWALSALAEGSLEEAVEAMQSAATLDEQLARLYDLSVDYGAELEKGAWDLGLTCIPAESLPGDLFPPSGETESLDRTVEDFEGSKFIAIYSDEGTIRLLGDFQARIPESMRAASLEEADAVLYLAHTSEARSDYGAHEHIKKEIIKIIVRVAVLFEKTAYSKISQNKPCRKQHAVPSDLVVSQKRNCECGRICVPV